MDPAPQSRPRPRILARAALLLLGGLGGLLALESFHRVRLYGPAALTPAGMNSIRPLGQAGMLEASEHWELHYQLRPELDRRFKLASFRTNADGLRDVDYERAKPADTFRVAFVGDSFTMGSGVELEDLFHSRLEALWNSRAGDLTVECLNFGVGGYNLLSYAGTVEHRALGYEPDLILVGVHSNDLDRPPQSAERPPYEPKDEVLPFWQLHCLRSLWHSTAAETDDELASPRTPRRRIETFEDQPGRQEQQDTYVREQFTRMSERCDEAGVALGIVHLDQNETRNRKLIARRLATLSAEAGLPFFDVLPLFAGSAPGEYSIFPDDSHPDARAHAIFARGIGRFLWRAGLLPEALGADEARD